MTRLLSVLACIAALSPLEAVAHSVLKYSQPANGATLSAPPSELAMTFSKDIRLTGLTLADQKIDVPDAAGFDVEFSVPLPGVASGEHTIEWRGISADGHVMTGNVSFSVQ
ncbi:copper resistance CopC family protein [Tateyamaria sp. SN6-1]|uniref:copper resistance CopC family protein n=1 Tax=Tateyamaria sp. SN6-1 TaxID=3092148 RepID=UPI0039F56183